jgi:hypothetical protein
MYIFPLLAYVLIVYFIYSFFFTFNEVSYVKSEIDNNTYTIRRGNVKSDMYLKKSADTLAKIHLNIVNLIEHLKQKYPNDHVISKLQQNYNSGILSEAAVDKRFTTYTIDKTDIHICLRTRDDNEELYDINLLMYVVLHELAHLCNYDKDGKPIQGHGKEFIQIFQKLVRESIDINIYTFEDYKKHPKEYCGIIINSQIM